jgi:ankyrin repeat protein
VARVEDEQKDFYPLHQAVLEADGEAVLFLIKAGVPLNELDEIGHAPLHWAVFGGYADIVQYLLEAGADPNRYAEDGVTPRWRARDFGLIEIEQLLAQYGGEITTNEDFNSNAFQLFNELLGMPLSKEEPEASEVPTGYLERLQKWWKRGKKQD